MKTTSPTWRPSAKINCRERLLKFSYIWLLVCFNEYIHRIFNDSFNNSFLQAFYGMKAIFENLILKEAPKGKKRPHSNQEIALANSRHLGNIHLKTANEFRAVLYNIVFFKLHNPELYSPAVSFKLYCRYVTNIQT